MTSIPIATRTGVHLPVNPYRRHKIVLLGDSVTASYHGTKSATEQSWSANGYFSWANALMGNPFDVVVGGLGGIQAHELLPYIASDVIPNDPDFCFVLIGANNITGSVNTYAEIIADIQANYDKLAAMNITVIAGTIMPQGGPLTTGQATVLVDVNEWIKNYCLEKGHVCVDFYGAMVDPDSAVAAPAANMLFDTKHPTPTGAYRMGRVIANTLEFTVPKYPALYRGNTLPGTEALSNPPMRGTGGTLGAGASGTVANNWTIVRQNGDNTVTCTGNSAADADDIYSNNTWQLITFDGAGVSDSEVWVYEQLFRGGHSLAEGDVVEASVEVEVNLSAGALNPMLHARFIGDAITVDLYSLKQNQLIQEDLINQRLTLKTPPITLPACTSTATITFWIKTEGVAGETGTVKIRNASFKKVEA